jgi:hypothetical protein
MLRFKKRRRLFACHFIRASFHYLLSEAIAAGCGPGASIPAIYAQPTVEAVRQLKLHKVRIVR